MVLEKLLNVNLKRRARMWKKVMLRKTGRNIMAVALLLMLFTLFGCTTGVKKDPGLTDFEAPNIPQNVTGVGKERAILINWSANTEPDLVGYRVYRSTNSGGPFTLIATVGTQPAPSYLDNDQQNGLVNDQYYYYKISSFDTQGKESDLSRTNAVQIRAGMPPEERPPRVVNIKARASTKAVYVAWDKVTSSHIKGYNIYRGLSTSAGGVNWISSVPQGTPGYVDTSVTKSSAEQYTYIIRSFNENYTESENSDPVQVTLKSGDDTIPGAPIDLDVSNDTDPIISWRKPTNNEDGSNIYDGENPTLDIDSYLIFRANSNDGLFSLIGIVEDNGTANMTQTFKDINGTPYNLYAVKALDRNGNASQLSSITTQASDADVPTVPTGLMAWGSSATEAGIRLAWESSKHAVSYNVYFSTVADGGYTKMLTGQPQWTEASAYVINTYPSSFNQNPEKKGKKLEFGTPYFFKVSAVSSSGKESGLSQYAKAYPGGMFVAMLEGENPNWEFDDEANDGQNHFFVVYSSKDYKNIDYYSGAGVALLVPSTVGTPGNGDRFRYGAGNLLSSDYFRLPVPTNGAYRYNVYAYYYPHTSSGNWRVSVREDGIINTTLLEKDLNGYSPVNRGRTSMALGQIQLDAGVRGVDIDCTAINAGSGGGATLFLDALIFVRVM
jgi:fibronectin type 3 domain-containing protein